MRKVEVSFETQSKAKEFPGFVSTWDKKVCEFHMFTNGHTSDLMAIVEDEDGRISHVPTNLVRFVDRQSKPVPKNAQPYQFADRIKYKLISSEIVRAMTNMRLTKEQREKLQWVAEQVISNHLIYSDKGYKK